MKKYLLIPVFILFTSCASTTFIEKDSPALERGVAATGAALKVGDFPAAIIYNEGVQKIIAAPKNPIDVKPIIVNGVQYTLIPLSLAKTTIVIEGGKIVSPNTSSANSYNNNEAP